MSLPALAIRRPITTLMVYIGVVLFGVISAWNLRQELFPPITYPQLSIVTPYANAAPEEIETLIAKPIEEAVGSISGLRKVTSISREGLSLVVAEFGWEQNMDFASLAVREKLDLIKERLPRDAQEPVVVKFNPFELPIMNISLSSETRTPVDLKRVARKWFKDELEKIEGVASVGISGGLDEEIQVLVDRAKLQASNVSIVDITDAVSKANLNFPGGTIKESFYEYLIRTLGEFESVDEIRELPVRRENTRQADTPFEKEALEKEPSNRLILIKDLAEVKRTVRKRTSYSRYNSIPNVTLSLQKQAKSNTVKTIQKVKKRLIELRDEVPADV